MTRHFTGRHMTAILVFGFGVVVAVNLLMATLAVGSFGGAVVENSYVASQKFNTWLEQAREENALGWTASVARGGNGHLQVATSGAPEGTQATVELRHPLGREQSIALTLRSDGKGGFSSADPLPEGRWLVRLTLSHGADQMRLERPVG
jgi:nitrogen fixation protein FixH